MNMKENLKLNLQFFASDSTLPQEFNPDHVMMHEMKDGTLLNNFSEPITLEVAENSKIMQLGQYQEMDGTEKSFTFWADKPGAYWVGEGQKIKTDKPTIVNATMRAEKLGVILIASREYLNYTYSKFFETMKPFIVEAFHKKFDEAGILGVQNPFAQSIEQAVVKSGNIVDGDIDFNNIIALEDVLIDKDIEANAFISKTSNKSALRKAIDADTKEAIYDRSSNTIDGITTVELKSSSLPKGTVYTGDFDHLYYGIPYPIHYAISTEGQLSTIVNKDGSPVNLFEQELIALRATMDVALLIANEDAFARLGAAPVDPGAEVVSPVA
ncbi:phage major capsid protein [Macrococcoides canis]|uniref:phage major capsid protein n=1 Tax=Macrococcoides canis TaxID=1855823 RepID=UPI00207C5BDE|nr:phage major capsid protein [Macrococcus canis]MCO4095714.1 phage major capsid protein [Macrococcus canis]UTH08423.1 phage major capsid protein [Macrococcus canis]